MEKSGAKITLFPKKNSCSAVSSESPEADIHRVNQILTDRGGTN